LTLVVGEEVPVNRCKISQNFSPAGVSDLQFVELGGEFPRVGLTSGEPMLGSIL